MYNDEENAAEVFVEEDDDPFRNYGEGWQEEIVGE